MLRDAESCYSSGDADLNSVHFDPNDQKYRCFCHQCHSTTGVKIIAALLCLTVLLELWSLIWHIMSSNPTGNNSVLTSFCQLFIGAAISSSVVYALKTENASFLSPYLLLQGLGLLAVFIIFISLTVITLTEDLATIKTFVESGTQISVEEGNDQYLIYLGWTLMASCALVLLFQFWLITVTYSCWMFFRDKKQFGYIKHRTPSLIIARPRSSVKVKNENSDNNMINRFIRSMSADELITQFKNSQHRPAAATVSFDCSTKDTIIIA